MYHLHVKAGMNKWLAWRKCKSRMRAARNQKNLDDGASRLDRESAIMGIGDPEDAGEWERIDVTIDSGSAVSAIPECVAKDWPMYDCTDGPAAYTSASDHSVHVKGIKHPRLQFQNGLEANVSVKVCSPLKKPIFSVARMNRAFRIVLDGDESYAECKKTGAKIRIYMRGGVFVMPVWIRKPPFHGQA